MTDAASTPAAPATPAVDPTPKPDPAPALRAYLQRCEVRLSTIHRVASALLSGAGLVVIFPALAKDSVARVLRSLVSSGVDLPRGLLFAAELVSFALPLAALWLLLKDLTGFYFAGNHFEAGDALAFHPRFAVSGLRIATDELDEDTARALHAARRDPRLRAFLLPENAFSRTRIDRQAARYGLGGGEDDARQDALLELSTTRDRTLVEQAAGLEQVLARHVLNVQLLVLRYAKAVLAMLTTAAAAFAAGAVVDTAEVQRAPQQYWLAGLLALWAPAVVVAVTAPMRWVTRRSMSDGAHDRAVKEDHEFTQFEDVAVRLATLTWLLALVSVAVTIVRHDLDRHAAAAVVTMLVSAVLLASALSKWAGRRAVSRLLARHASR